ncbi:peptidyl-tRNA hydrolase [Hypoxylon trugodes]|uniref:peptidyl-tRNA hydrolase n=1 Tax=Hypoxylon trugodes TaxID=326681 RepID=UPI002191F4D4|nr:peptidyl-tRNA hydrolase [Hypoxylon trugodes]KAI1390575.1 peptidyl-tRNA hydrolase [Hypoxylon trugodes]
MFDPRFLIVSLGNQAPYYECLHSAGHFALVSAQRLIGASQPPFASERYGRKACLASPSHTYTMVQSPTLMNVSGPWVAKAWKEMLENHQLKPSELSLVVVHDDLEEELGHVRIRKWNASHRGHNGIKSINSSLRIGDFPGTHWSRISIGIGRPEARDQASVSDYVLRKMTRYQRDIIDKKAGPGVLNCLHLLQDDWEERYSKEASKS